MRISFLFFVVVVVVFFFRSFFYSARNIEVNANDITPVLVQYFV